MFIQLAQALNQVQTGGLASTNVSYGVFDLHPLQLQIAMDVLWEHARRRPVPVGVQINDAGIGGPPTPFARGSLRDELLRVLHPATAFGSMGGETLVEALVQMLQNLEQPILTPGQTQPAAPNRLWHHFIYAYMIENTRSFGIFSKVLHELLHGERLGGVSDASHRWARATEELFFRNAGFSFIYSTQSSIRPDPAATRRNGYYRMFAMDLNHGTDDNAPYPYIKAEAHNAEFVATLELLLSEIWRGYMNATNTSGAKTTDDSLMEDLVRKLQEMLTERRIQGNLTREEFVAVCMAAWFHLTLLSPNSPIVVDLKADATSPEERLRRIGERVGMAPHSKARSLFFLSQPLSALLLEIEQGTYSGNTGPSNVRALYDPNVTPNVTKDTLEILNHWSAATGRNLKAVPIVGR